MSDPTPKNLKRAKVLDEAKVFARLVNAGIGPVTPAERFACELMTLAEENKRLGEERDWYANESVRLRGVAHSAQEERDEAREAFEDRLKGYNTAVESYSQMLHTTYRERDSLKARLDAMQTDGRHLPGHAVLWAAVNGKVCVRPPLEDCSYDHELVPVGELQRLREVIVEEKLNVLVAADIARERKARCEELERQAQQYRAELFTSSHPWQGGEGHHCGYRDEQWSRPCEIRKDRHTYPDPLSAAAPEPATREQLHATPSEVTASECGYCDLGHPCGQEHVAEPKADHAWESAEEFHQMPSEACRTPNKCHFSGDCNLPREAHPPSPEWTEA